MDFNKKYTITMRRDKGKNEEMNKTEKNIVL